MQEKSHVKDLAIGGAIIATCFLPIFRSGGRGGLTFWGWVINHTVFGPPVEYVPEEDYTRELEGVEVPIPFLSESELDKAKAYYQISEPSARELLTHQYRCEAGIATWNSSNNVEAIPF